MTREDIIRIAVAVSFEQQKLKRLSEQVKEQEKRLKKMEAELELALTTFRSLKGRPD